MVIQSIRKQLLDASYMDRRRLAQARHSRVGEGDHDAARIGSRVGTTNHAVINQPGDASVIPDREMSARSASSVIRSSPPATAS